MQWPDVTSNRGRPLPISSSHKLYCIQLFVSRQWTINSPCRSAILLVIQELNNCLPITLMHNAQPMAACISYILRVILKARDKIIIRVNVTLCRTARPQARARVSQWKNDWPPPPHHWCSLSLAMTQGLPMHVARRQRARCLSGTQSYKRPAVQTINV